MEEKASNLKILVQRDGEDVVNMTFPIYTLNIIETVMPAPVVEKLEKRDINLGSLVTKAKDSGLVPQTIFEMDLPEENKYYKVWIQ